ncbi:3-dehydroquinate synthase [Halalkalibacter alkalisediminis]|uniref:3-dehydroquinate synthase n=1 Tax=Halalkalibacter alkalisediminis TaxID=935616 RepID=A0ABV6NIB0_9BACI|nr:3-dehydroquinate synthase [Halalkalibacter alkalisediminis]
MRKVQIEAESKDYFVYIEPGIRHLIGDKIKNVMTEPVSSVLVITDSHVAPLYLNDVVESFDNQLPVYTEVIKCGEASKSLAVYDQVLTEALSSSLDRKSLIVALGGGVVGDLAGFVAATYMRGIRFIQVPTTLLAHDSSVGGKVAINHPLGKNMVGCFHQPEAVFYDTEALYSMPVREWRSGFAEVIKHGFIHDHTFLNNLQELNGIEQLPVEKLGEILETSIRVKAKIVKEDEKENGVRAFLNFGHTLGHALEAELGYGVLTHGEAVVVGMIFSLRVSEEMYQIDLQVKEFEKWLNDLGFQTEIPPDCEPDLLLAKMRQDKKAEAGSIRMVLLKKIGEAALIDIPPTLVKQLLVERMGVEKIG